MRLAAIALHTSFEPTHAPAVPPTPVAWAWSSDLGAWSWGSTSDLSRTPPIYRSAAAYRAAVDAARALVDAAAARRGMQLAR